MNQQLRLEASPDPEMLVLALMDRAEQDQDLNQTKERLCKLEESLRDMVSPEAWELIMKWDEEAADFRFRLVKNVLASLGIAVSVDSSFAGLRGA